MKIIPREAGRITYSTEIRRLKTSLKLSNYQRDMLVGSILGDGGLYENWSKTNYRFQLCHSTRQSAYVNWKFSILKDWILSKPKIYRDSIRFNTISHSDLTELGLIFYQNKKKYIPENIYDLLTPFVVAVCLM